MEPGSGFADKSIGNTYRRLRYLACASLVGMPLLTALAGFAAGHSLQDSFSDYYFVVKDGGLPRTLFVMFLAFLGGVLFSYRGLDEHDNNIHNAAGLFSFGVALFPMRCVTTEHPFCEPGLLPDLHLPAAALLYLAAFASVLYGGGPRLRAAFERLPDTQLWLKKLRNIKILSSTLMTIGIITFLFHNPFKAYLPQFSWIFWVEYLGFFGFGIYWLRLMRLINAANKEARRAQPVAAAAAVVSEEAEAPPALEPSIAPEPQVQEWNDIP